MSNQPQNPWNTPQQPYAQQPAQQPHAQQQPYGQQGWAPVSPTGFQPGQEIPQEDRTAAALAHGSTLIAMVVSGGWLSFVGPLVMWMLYKDRSPYVRHAAAGAFNFNIWVTLATIVGWLMVFSIVLLPIGVGVMVITAIMQIWSHTRALLRSLRGENYSYPFQTRILR